jgi:RNA polymerase sigma factor (TIGR02999 family)
LAAQRPDLPAQRGALDALVPLIYDELRVIARKFLCGERAGHTLQTTALVHEAYLRLLGQHNLSPDDRGRFFAIAATTIRRILVDHAKRRACVKRGGGGGAGRARQRLSELAAADVPAAADGGRDDLLALDEALEELARLSPRAAQVVTMRYFGGLTVEQVAVAMQLSPRTVADDWAMARAWLRRALAGALHRPGARREVPRE